MVVYSDQTRKNKWESHVAGGNAQKVNVKSNPCPFSCVVVAPGASDKSTFISGGKEIAFYYSAFREKWAKAGFPPPPVMDRASDFDLVEFLAGQVKIWSVNVNDEKSQKKIQVILALANGLGIYDQVICGLN